MKPRFFVKKIALNNPLGGLNENEIVRHPSLAYEDGYADARNYGSEGYFIAAGYTPNNIYQYAAGFKAGLTVNHLSNRIWSPSSEEVPTG